MESSLVLHLPGYPVILLLINIGSIQMERLIEPKMDKVAWGLR